MLSFTLISLAPALLQEPGPLPADAFGDEVVALGDVDLDGAGDFLVTAPLSEHWLWVVSGADGGVIHHLTGDPGNERGSVGVAGDWNEDGVPDFAAVVQNSLRVYSGKDASQLFALGETVAGRVLGGQFAYLGDIDEDGTGDFVMTTGGRDRQDRRKHAVLISCGKRSVLHEPAEPNGPLLFVGNAGDVDGDGTADAFVGGGLDRETGKTHVFSGRDGRTLLTLRGGEAAGRAGDLDRDGHADLLTTASRGARGEWVSPTVTACSGESGAVLFSMESPVSGFGDPLAAAGDVDGDGVSEVLAGARGGLDRGFVGLYSGADGSLLREWPAAKADLIADWAFAGLGDVDGDAIPDVAIGLTYPDEPGAVRVFSGKDGGELYRLDEETLVARVK